MTGTPGRPLSAELSEQLMAVAVDILAEDGWSRLNSDRIAARARAGKAGIYRRWPSMPVLVREAVSRFDLVPVPDDTGSLRGDLLALLERWTRSLDRQERATASIVGAARFDNDLRAALDAEPRAAEEFERLSSRNRYAVLYRVHDAKRPETRERRIRQFVEMLARGERPYP